MRLYNIELDAITIPEHNISSTLEPNSDGISNNKPSALRVLNVFYKKTQVSRFPPQPPDTLDERIGKWSFIGVLAVWSGLATPVVFTIRGDKTAQQQWSMRVVQ